MMKKLAIAAVATLSLSAGAALAVPTGGQINNVDFSFEGPFGKFDKKQLQRGLQVFTESCAACHGLKYVPLRTLGDKGGPEFTSDEVRAYAKQNFEVFDPELDDFRPAKPIDNFPDVTSVGAPDLSLMAKKRAGFSGPYGTGLNQLFKGMGGPEYIASFLTGYTGKEKEEAGSIFYENKAFPASGDDKYGWVAMPPPLEDGLVEYAGGYDNSAQDMAEDVAAFLMWTAEPKLMARKQAGLTSVMFLTLLAVLLYLTNKRIWAPIKGKRRDS